MTFHEVALYKNKEVEIPPGGSLAPSASTRAHAKARGLVAEVFASRPPEGAKSCNIFFLTASKV